MNLVLFRAYCTFVNDLRFVQSRLYSNLHGLNNKICDEMKYPVKKILLTQLDHHSKKNEILQRSVESNITGRPRPFFPERNAYISFNFEVTQKSLNMGRFENYTFHLIK